MIKSSPISSTMTFWKRIVLILLLISIISILPIFLLINVSPTQAGGINCIDNSWVVNNQSDLNTAITCFNDKTSAGTYTISVTQNISLTTSNTIISNTNTYVNLLIEGNGNTIDGQGISSVRPFIISNTVVTISNITITGGNGNLNLNDRGGGIFNDGGNLTVNNSNLKNNSAPFGGAIASDNGKLTVNNSIISGNMATLGWGGAIVGNGSLTISNSNLNGNSAGYGGSIGNANDSILTINNSTISDNSADFGGGIINSGTIFISNTTFFGNSAITGGGIYNGGNIVISNSTMSGNSATLVGGGIHNSNALTVSSSTINNNSALRFGGGIHNYETVIVHNSIIANSIGGDCYNSGGIIKDDGYNIVEDNSCGFSEGSDPKLGPLSDNGGDTHTHALLPGSPAIDTGNSILTSDQRGITRPQGIADDIGAFELIFYTVYLPKILK